MSRRVWTGNELAILHAHYPTTRAKDLVPLLPGRGTRQILAKAWSLGLKKTPETIARHAREAMADPNHRGRTAHFCPGNKPWNADMKGLDIGGKDTRFKPGHLPHTWHPIGHERRSKEGYLERKVTDTGVTRRDYRPVHHLVWIDAGRDIPPGHILVFRDGDKTHIALDNLELITRCENMARNTVHRLPKELVQIVQLRGALNRKINRIKKEHDEQRNDR